MKELENRDESLILSKSNKSRRNFQIYGLLLFLWGSGLLFIFLTGFREVKPPPIKIPVLLLSLSLVIGGIRMIQYSFYQAHGNTEFDFYSHLAIGMVDNILSTIAFLNFALMFILVGIYVSYPFGIVGAFFFILFTIGFVTGIKEFITKRKIAKQFSPSKIKLQTTRISKYGVTIIIKFSNPTSLLEQTHLDFALRFLKEKQIKTSRKNDDNVKFDLKTFVNFEEKKKALLKDGKAIAEFRVPIDIEAYNNLDFNEPEYWELEVSEKESGLYTRFVLDRNL